MYILQSIYGSQAGLLPVLIISFIPADKIINNIEVFT